MGFDFLFESCIAFFADLSHFTMFLCTMKNRFCLSTCCKANKTKSCIFIEHKIGGHCKCILNWAKKAKSRFYKKQFLTNDVLILVLFPDAEYYCTVCNLSELWKKVVNFVSFNLMHLKLIIKIGTITFAYVRLLNKPCKNEVVLREQNLSLGEVLDLSSQLV